LLALNYILTVKLYVKGFLSAMHFPCPGKVDNGTPQNTFRWKAKSWQLFVIHMDAGKPVSDDRSKYAHNNL
jgi:hypothetical protein